MESRPLPAPHRSWNWICCDANTDQAHPIPGITAGWVGPVISVEFESDDSNASLPDDLYNQKGGTKITIADATTSTVGKTFDGYYYNNQKLVKDANGKYLLPCVNCVLDARFVDA